jgi:uncharacterized protein YkuJ
MIHPIGYEFERNGVVYKIVDYSSQTDEYTVQWRSSNGDNGIKCVSIGWIDEKGE